MNSQFVKQKNKTKKQQQIIIIIIKNTAPDLIPFGTIQLFRFEKRGHGNMMLWWHFDNCTLLQIQDANNMFGIKSNGRCMIR